MMSSTHRLECLYIPLNCCHDEDEMIAYSYDHIHIRTREPRATAEYFERMFGAEILESVQSDGASRIDLDLQGLIIFLAQAAPDVPDGPADPYVGLDHFGLRVDNLAEAAADLKAKGAEFVTEPHELRPGLSIAFIRAPGGVRVELLQRSGKFPE